jgi:hypothetical protein
MKMRKKRYRVVLVGVPDDEMEQYEAQPKKVFRRWWNLPEVQRFGFPIALFCLWIVIGAIGFGVRFEREVAMGIFGILGIAAVWVTLALIRGMKEQSTWKTPSSVDSR